MKSEVYLTVVWGRNTLGNIQTHLLNMIVLQVRWSVSASYLDSFRENEERGEDEEESIDKACQNLCSHIAESQRGHRWVKRTDYQTRDAELRLDGLTHRKRYRWISTWRWRRLPDQPAGQCSQKTCGRSLRSDLNWTHDTHVKRGIKEQNQRIWTCSYCSRQNSAVIQGVQTPAALCQTHSGGCSHTPLRNTENNPFIFAVGWKCLGLT